MTAASPTQLDLGSERRALPWGRWSLRSVALTYLTILLILPLIVILQDGLAGGLTPLMNVFLRPVPRSALLLTLWTAAIMAVINGVMGLITAYVLVRYRFPGKAFLNAVVDLPISIPTLVTGVMLVVLYGPQSAVGGWFSQNLGFKIIFAPPGIILALLFVTFPFVVRTVQPVLEALDRDQEEAAATLGASDWLIFRRVTFPALLLPLTSGILLSFARAVGEFGAIVIVAGNIPLRTQTAAVYVFGEVESENRRGASAMSIVMLAIAFTLVFVIDRLQKRRGEIA
jgi:sulfate transport system permease protein